MPASRRILVADIGGTFSRFAHFQLDEHKDGLRLRLLPESRLKLLTASASSFSALLEQLRHTKSPGGYTLLPSSPARAEYQLACAAMAAPCAVTNDTCIAPNITWPLSRLDIERIADAPAGLLNDFAAQGRACLFPEILGLHTVLSGQASAEHPSVILGAGTGLGKAQILSDSFNGKAGDFIMPSVQQAPATEIILPASAFTNAGLAALEKRVMPSEGGHSAFPFRGAEEADYESFMRKVSGRKEVIGDMAVTGYGLSVLYAYFSGESTLRNPPDVTPLLKNTPQATEWFARFYGRACRNFVLETLGLGGVYLSGGMLSHVPGLLHHPAFEAEFRSSETQGHLMENVPVRWVSNQNAGLWGAAIYGLRLAIV